MEMKYILLGVLCLCGMQSYPTNAQVASPLMQMLLMKQAGVSNDVVMAQFLSSQGDQSLGDMYAYINNKDKAALLSIMGLTTGIDLPAEIIPFLKGGTAEEMRNNLIAQMAASNGVDPTLVQYLLNRGSITTNNEILKIQMVIQMASQMSAIDPMTKGILTAILNGEDFNSTTMTDTLKRSLIQTDDTFMNLALKAMFGGDTKSAIAYMYLSQNKDSFTTGKTYPDNLALFRYMVDQQMAGKIDSKMVLNLALGVDTPGLNSAYSFQETFGVDALDFVCAAHDASIQVDCPAFKNKVFFTAADCQNAGCCMTMSMGILPKCFKNVLGTIGVGLAQHLIDDTHLATLFTGGVLPNLTQFWPAGFPYLPTDPAVVGQVAILRDIMATNNFSSSLHIGGRIYGGLNPTVLPAQKPSGLRPGWVYRPHGATPLPFATPIPADIRINSNNVSEFGGPPAAPEDPPAPLIDVSVYHPQSCGNVLQQDRYECVPNDVVLADRTSGKGLCEAEGCCFDPAWDDFSITACFYTIDRGQCYNVTEKLDCGTPGITQEECLTNPRCCYDSTTTLNEIGTNPWCFYKKYSHETPADLCVRVAQADRQPCFTNDNLNALVSENSCKLAGCCYEKVTLNYYQKLVLGQTSPAACYKPKVPTYTPVEPAPAAAAAASAPPAACDYSTSHLPSRVDCGNHGWFACQVFQGCCFKRSYGIPHFPSCFTKS